MRPIASVLDKYHELENQEIFFSDLKSLNDPMEGFIEFFWEGDKIVWKNFLIHYLLCLEHILLLAKLTEDDKEVTPFDIPIFKTIEDFPTEIYKNSFKKACTDFFENPAIQKYIDFLASRTTPINRDELTSHLQNIHLFALSAVIGVHRDLGFGI